MQKLTIDEILQMFLKGWCPIIHDGHIRGFKNNN